MVIYLLGEHGYRTAYNEEEAKLHEKEGYVRKDLSGPAKEKTAESEEKPKRTRRTKAQMNELNQHDD
jgi:hypothetical protein